MNNKDNIHSTSQSHKNRLKDYKINPENIPRPNALNEMYHNELKEPIYVTSISTIPPFSSTFFKVIENENSSCRFIRSTITCLPSNQKLLNDINLPLGIYFQPFNSLLEDEENKMYKNTLNDDDYNEKILRCKRCKSYMNMKYKIAFDDRGQKKMIKCNICGLLNDFSSYTQIDIYDSLSSATLDYKITKKDSTQFYPHLLFAIDISNDISFAFYIIQSLSSLIENIINKENTYLAITLFDSEKIIYFIEEKNDIKIIYQTDINEPFVAVDPKKLFLKAHQSTSIGKILEKISIYLDKLTIKPTNTNVSGAMIAAGFNALVNFGGRIILFSANSCFKGYLSTKIPLSIKVNGKEEDLNNSKEIEEMILKCNKNKIGIDQYIVIDTANKSNYNIYQPNYERYIQNFSRLSNETGGKVSIYPIDYNNLNTITNSTYEKVYYDLSSILTSNTFYDVKVMLRHSQEITCQEILGGFDKKVGEAFELAVADSDFSVGYFFRYSNSLKIGQTVDIQIAVAYYDSFGSEKMRIYNYTLTSTDDVNKLYLSCDVDAMAKMTIMKTISKYPIYPQQVSENQPDVISLVGDYLYKKILSSFKYYRYEGAIDKDPSQLVLPSTLKYYPLYLYSFKRRLKLYSLNKSLHLLNLRNKMMRTSIDKCIKFLFPRFYRIDDIVFDQTYLAKNIIDKSLIIHNIGEVNKYGIIQKPYMLRLSIDNIDFDSAYLIDDGEYIDFLVFNYIEFDFYDDVFHQATWSDCVERNVSEIVEDDNREINKKIRSVIDELRKENMNTIQPLRIFFMNERSIGNNTYLYTKLIEDEFGRECNYVDYLCSLHADIQKMIY